MSDLNARNEEEEKQLSTHVEAPLGFEDEKDGDFIVPRVKIIQLLSPEFKEKLADDGDILNSLTKEKLNGAVFIPVFKFDNNIKWKPRSEGGGIACIAKDAKCGVPSDGSPFLLCRDCKANEFDNTKQGAASFPTCTKYINFFGFIQGEPFPIVLSFAKTSYNEGKKLYSLAKVTMQNMWNHGYKLTTKKMAKGGNEWFVPVVTMAGKTSDEDRAHARQMFENFRNREIKVDAEESEGSSDQGGTTANVEGTEY